MQSWNANAMMLLVKTSVDYRCFVVPSYAMYGRNLKVHGFGRIDMYLVNLPCFADRNFSRKAAKSELGIICCLLIFLSPKEWQTYRQHWFCSSTVLSSCINYLYIVWWNVNQLCIVWWNVNSEMILLLFMWKNPFHHRNTTYRQYHFTICSMLRFDEFLL